VAPLIAQHSKGVDLMHPDAGQRVLSLACRLGLLLAVALAGGTSRHQRVAF
jgi:hypothetical protein